MSFASISSALAIASGNRASRFLAFVILAFVLSALIKSRLASTPVETTVARQAPDFWIDNPLIRISNESGIEESRLSGRRIIHLPPGNQTQIEMPQWQSSTGENYRIKSDVGLIDHPAQTITLSGNVVLVGSIDESARRFNLSTQALVVLPRNRVAFAETPVEVTQLNGTRIRAEGIVIDNNASRIVLSGRVRARLERHVP